MDQVVTRKGRWSDVTAEQRGVYTAYHWTGRGRDGLEVAYGAAEKRPNATVVVKYGSSGTDARLLRRTV